MGNRLSKLCIDDTMYQTEIPDEITNKYLNGIPDPHEIRAIIPGTVVEIRVKKGERVSQGQVIIILEAMKVYNELEAGIEGIIEDINVSPGDKVEKDRIMARIGEQ